MALVPIHVVMIGLVAVPFFRRLGYDPVTAWYAAMLGGLQDMFSFGIDAGGAGRALALPLHEFALMEAAALIGWKGAELIGLFGATILGPMVLTAALSLGGLIHNRPPAEEILAAAF